MTTASQMGIPSNNFGIYQPKLKHRWRLEFVGIPGVDSTNNSLTMQAIKCNRPKLEWEQNELRRYNSVAWVMGKHTWNEISITFEDDISSYAVTALQKQLDRQQALIGDGWPEESTSGDFLASAISGAYYKFVTWLTVLDGSVNPLDKWLLEGCWFTSVDFGSLDYEDSGKVTIDVTMRYDHARQQINGSQYKNSTLVLANAPGM
jgi:hypothetical protein